MREAAGAWKPRFLYSAAAPESALAVSATMGVSSPPFISRIRRMASTPSMFGIMWSMKMMSKLLSAKCTMASGPLIALTTVIL